MYKNEIIEINVFLLYFLDKIKKRYGALGQVLCHTIDRGSNTNIGISLAGHRDRNKMACFIAGINPKGIASATQLEIGDEILEVSQHANMLLLGASFIRN